jgi:hypothetical protein
MPSESPWIAHQNTFRESTLNPPGKCELEGPHSFVACSWGVSKMTRFGPLGELDIAMDSPYCKEAMRLGPGSMHGVFSKWGGGGGQTPKNKYVSCLQEISFLPPPWFGPRIVCDKDHVLLDLCVCACVCVCVCVCACVCACVCVCVRVCVCVCV